MAAYKGARTSGGLPIGSIDPVANADQLAELVLRAGRQAYWQWLPESDSLLPIANWFKVTGYPDHSQMQMSLFLEAGTPSSGGSASADKVFNDLVTGRVDDADFEIRLCKSSGESFWAQIWCTATHRDQSGRATSVVGSVTDVSASKVIEERARFAASAFDTHIPLVITDAQGTVVQINRAFTNLLQYEANEIVGHDMRILRSSKHDEQFYEDMYSHVLAGKRWGGEIWRRRKDGTEVPLWQTVNVVRKEDGELSHVMGLMIDISERIAAQRDVERLAYFDPLTDLPNRRTLMSELRSELEACALSGARGALVFLDLDNFKTINDSMGHHAGDTLLTQLAKRLRSAVRRDDLVSRFGGDEFVLLLKGVRGDEAQTKKLDAVVKRIELALQEPYSIDGRNIHATASLGVVTFPKEASTAEDYIRFADAAMYQAKAGGRNKHRYYEPSMAAHANERLELEQALRASLNAGQLELFYQPQFAHGEGAVAVEALARWYHPELGFTPPHKFLPIAEESGLINDLGHWVLTDACNAIREWSRDGTMETIDHVSINVSTAQFVDPQFEATLVQECERAQITHAQVRLELKEGTFVSDVAQAAKKMKALKDLGFHFSLDDFGTGYSSLSHMRKLPFDEIKVDRSFVADIGTDEEGDAILRTIIQLGLNLNMEVVAEGVESDLQRAFLLENGCTRYQGFLFARPMSRPDLQHFLKDHG